MGDNTVEDMLRIIYKRLVESENDYPMTEEQFINHSFKRMAEENIDINNLISNTIDIEN